MTKPTLKIGQVPDKTPAKMTIQVEPDLQHELELYSRIYAEAYGDSQSVTTLVPFMLQKFLEGDPGFKKAKRELRAAT